MKINGIDIRRFGARQLTVDEQPPRISVSYEMQTKALMPMEFATDIPLGTLEITLYFSAKNRAELQRTISSFTQLLKASCVIEEIKGYKGKYKGYLTGNSTEKLIDLRKRTMTLSFDGYFYDDEKRSVFDGEESGRIYAEGSREAPCIVEIYAKTALSNYAITLNEEEYKVKALEAGETLIIDGQTGKVTINEENAFDIIDMWAFPKLHMGYNDLEFSSAGAKVTVRHLPMWL